MQLNDLSIFNTPDVTKDGGSFISSREQNKSKLDSPNDDANESSSTHGSERAESEEIRKTNSFLLDTAQGIQIFYASKKARPSSQRLSNTESKSKINVT